MNRTPFFAALAVATLSLALVPSRASADGESGSLLERLSAETAALAAKADAQIVVLVADERRYPGVLVGDPARLVIAIGEGADAMPREGKIRLAGGEISAKLLDSDADLGLAIYALSEAAPRKGPAPAGWDALVRGALAVAGGGAQPSLIGLPGGTCALDDVAASADVDSHVLWTPDGAVAGLRAGHIAGLPAANCAGCHLYGSSPQAGVAPMLARLATKTSPPQLAATWLRDPHAATAPSTARLTTAYNSRAYALLALRGQWASQAPSIDGPFVPGPVIARALDDVARPGAARLRRAYLGVVTQDAPPATTGQAWDSGTPLMSRVLDASGREIVAYTSTDSGRTWGQVADAVSFATVLPNSPAARAGLEKGMVIVAVDGAPALGTRAFARALARRRPGETITLSIRDRAEPVKVVLSDRDEDGKSLATAASVGLAVQPLTADLVAFLNLGKDVQGVVVRSVDDGGAAAAAGLRRGDVILSGGGGPIRDAGELEAVLGAASEAVLLDVLRGSERMALHLSLPKSDGKARAR